MKSDTFSFVDGDDWTIHVFRWLPDGPPRAVINLAHGMAEHAGRYGRIAEALAAGGFALYAEDHRGHGRSASSLETTGFGGKKGFDAVIEDLHRVTGIICREHPRTPIFLLGHSFGSFVAQGYIQRHGRDLAGAILSGTNQPHGLKNTVGYILASL